MEYSCHYLDVRERVQMLTWESTSDKKAVKEARQMCALRKRMERDAYEAKGLRIIIRRGYYTPLMIRNLTTGEFLTSN